MSVTATDPNLKHLQKPASKSPRRSQECGTDAEQGQQASGPKTPGVHAGGLLAKVLAISRARFEALRKICFSVTLNGAPVSWSWHCLAR